MNLHSAGRLFAWMRTHALEDAKALARGIFDAYWMQGRAMDNAGALRQVAVASGVPLAVADAGLASPDAAVLVRAEVDAAIAAGDFGSPFVIVNVDGEPFFGVDSFGLLDTRMESGGW